MFQPTQHLVQHFPAASESHHLHLPNPAMGFTDVSHAHLVQNPFLPFPNNPCTRLVLHHHLSSPFSFFRTRPGSKSIHLTHHHCRQRIKLYWDFTRSTFADNSAEPESSFYIVISCNNRLEFFLGDLIDQLTKRWSGLAMARRVFLEPAVLSRREHVVGHKSYVSRAKFLGSKHEIGIDCNGGVLKVKVDGRTSLVIKRLAWKFRGNERIYVDGIEVEFFWDVFNWVNDGDNANGHGVFIFQVGDAGVWPEMVGAEKRLMKKSLSSMAAGGGSTPMMSPSPSCSSVLQWTEESNDGGRSSCSSSTRSCGSNGGFSLLLYAWNKD